MPLHFQPTRDLDHSTEFDTRWAWLAQSIDLDEVLFSVVMLRCIPLHHA